MTAVGAKIEASSPGIEPGPRPSQSRVRSGTLQGRKSPEPRVQSREPKMIDVACVSGSCLSALDTRLFRRPAEESNPDLPVASQASSRWTSSPSEVENQEPRDERRRNGSRNTPLDSGLSTLDSSSCGGRNRTCVGTGNSRLPVPARASPHHSVGMAGSVVLAPDPARCQTSPWSASITPYGGRTRIAGVKDRHPEPLDERGVSGCARALSASGPGDARILV